MRSIDSVLHGWADWKLWGNANSSLPHTLPSAAGLGSHVAIIAGKATALSEPSDDATPSEQLPNLLDYLTVEMALDTFRYDHRCKLRRYLVGVYCECKRLDEPGIFWEFADRLARTL